MNTLKNNQQRAKPLDEAKMLSGDHSRTWVWSAILQLTPNMGPPKRLSIAHALSLLSHKSSAGGGGGGGGGVIAKMVNYCLH